MSKIGIIGGSGLYEIQGIENIEDISVDTPFGGPSDKFTCGILDGVEVVFLPRHGKGHKILPSELNYRANIYAMKKLGVERIISVSAVGSLKEDLRPMDFVIPSQFVDRTNQARKMTFFGNGIVAHVAFADPVCKQMAKEIFETGKELGINMHMGGTYVNMEGPAFSTRAESNLYRSWGMDIIGMTNMGEARLAREAEICYVSVSAVTDYDCWHQDHDSVTLEMILNNLRNNTENAKKLIKAMISKTDKLGECSCQSALATAIVTNPKVIPEKTKQDLAPIIGKYIK